MLIYKEKDDFDVDEEFVLETVKEYLLNQWDPSSRKATKGYCVGVAFVGKETMEELGREYKRDDGKKEHPVFSYPSSETKKPFVYPPDMENYLGEIVVLWEEGMAKDRIKELVEHSLEHLLGRHHS